jgi:hypothetical protein
MFAHQIQTKRFVSKQQRKRKKLTEKKKKTLRVGSKREKQFFVIKSCSLISFLFAKKEMLNQ